MDMNIANIILQFARGVKDAQTVLNEEVENDNVNANLSVMAIREATMGYDFEAEVNFATESEMKVTMFGRNKTNKMTTETKNSSKLHLEVKFENQMIINKDAIAD